MPYRVDIYCAAETVPPLSTVQSWLREKGSTALLCDNLDDTGSAHAPASNLDNPNWESIAVTHKLGEQAVLVECHRDDGSVSNLCRASANEWIDSIGPPGRSKKKQRVIDHLKATKFAIFCQVPFSGINDDDSDAFDALAAAGHFATFFAQEAGGFAYFEGEGFYDEKGPYLALE